MNTSRYMRNLRNISLVLILVCMTFSPSTEPTIIDTGTSDQFTMTTIRATTPIEGVGHALADDSEWPFSETILPLSARWWHAERDIGTGLFGDYTASEVIDFFVCNEVNFELYQDGQSAYVYLLTEGQDELDWSFEVPDTNDWYMVYYNRYYALTSVLVSGTHGIDNTGPSINWNLESESTYSGFKEITATVSDEYFDIASVALYIDGDLVDSESDESFIYQWDTTENTNGELIVRMTATDSVGNSNSLQVRVTVSNLNLTLPLIGLGVLGLVAVVLAGIYRSRTPKGIEPSVVTPSPATHEQTTSNFCPSCGTPVTSTSARFCAKCGASF